MAHPPMLTPERLREIRHIAPTAGPLGLEAIDELLFNLDQLRDLAIAWIDCGEDARRDTPRGQLRACGLILLQRLEGELSSTSLSSSVRSSRG